MRPACWLALAAADTGAQHNLECVHRAGGKPAKSSWWGSSRTTSTEAEVAPAPSQGSFSSRMPLQAALRAHMPLVPAVG